jgi:uncharacterized protein YqjF (DUF2071 family)
MAIFLRAKWQNIIMANYAVPPESLLPFLPKGVELDLYQGNAFVSLVGFLFKDVKLFNIPVPFFHTFEEVNLRFYVIRKNATEAKRGVVFINETVPSKAVAWVANKLYKEHYTSVPTRHNAEIKNGLKEIAYEWKPSNEWHHISIKASNNGVKMDVGSFEEFIFEHYFGYTRVSESITEEYKILHPSWKVNTVLDYQIRCDFANTYGKSFGILNGMEPHSVFMAEGSSVAVAWKRKKILE